MKTKFKNGFLVLILLGAGILAKTQHINIETINGQIIAEPLNAIESIKLPNDNLVISLSNSTPVTISLFSIEKIYFDQEVSIDQEIAAEKNKPTILTNPAMNEIEILNLSERQLWAEVYSIQGERLIQTMVSSATSSIAIDDLAVGLYILKLDGTTLKFVKK